MRTLLFPALAFALALACSGVGWAQTQITTGVIQGKVEDASGAIVPARRSWSRTWTHFTPAR